MYVCTRALFLCNALIIVEFGLFGCSSPRQLFTHVAQSYFALSVSSALNTRVLECRVVLYQSRARCLDFELQNRDNYERRVVEECILLLKPFTLHPTKNDSTKLQG